MKLSAFSVMDAYPERPGADDRMLEVVRLARVAEESGLTALWVAEHHFHDGGVCPSPPVLLSACGAVTRSLRLGSMVSVLPFHRPIDVAEEYAELDRLTSGRLNLGVGSGYLAQEFEGWGVDPAGKREAFDRSLATILAAFAGAEVAAVPGAARPVRLNVRPVQRPHPPIWVAAQRREAIGHVARRGYSLALIPYATVADRRELAEEIREYRANLPPGRHGAVAVAVHVFVGDDVAPARAALGRYLESRLGTQSRFYAEKAARDPAGASPEGIERSGFALFGPAGRVAEEFRRFEALGVDELLGIFDFGGLAEPLVHASVRAAGAVGGDGPDPARSPAPARPPSLRTNGI